MRTKMYKEWKKRSEARKHCALAVVRGSQKLSPRRRRRPLPGGAGRPKSNQLEMVPTFTYKPSFVRIDARNFELSCNRPIPPSLPSATDRGDYNTLRRSLAPIVTILNLTLIHHHGFSQRREATDARFI